MAFLRFIVSKKHPDSGVPDGVFSTAIGLRDADGITKRDRDALTEQLVWFTKHLPIPKRFNLSSSKGIAWFRDDALEFIARMHEIKRILEANGHVVHVLREDRVGYVVYEDKAQVVAEPFADTRIGA
jgi:hypothetical protein